MRADFARYTPLGTCCHMYTDHCLWCHCNMKWLQNFVGLCRKQKIWYTLPAEELLLGPYCFQCDPSDCMTSAPLCTNMKRICCCRGVTLLHPIDCAHLIPFFKCKPNVPCLLAESVLTMSRKCSNNPIVLNINQLINALHKLRG